MCDQRHRHDRAEGGRRRGSPAELIANWTAYEAPLGVKLRLAARNYWLRLRRRSTCCGNLGEPGC